MDTFIKALAEEVAKGETAYDKAIALSGIIPKWVSRSKAEGRVEGKAEVARNLIMMKMPIEMVAQAVQLPMEEVQALVAE